MNISLNVVFSKLLGPRRQGVEQGWLQVSGGIARIVGPIAMSNVFLNYGPRVVWAVVIAVIVLCLGCWIALYKRLVPLQIPDDLASFDRAFDAKEEDEKEEVALIVNLFVPSFSHVIITSYERMSMACFPYSLYSRLQKSIAGAPTSDESGVESEEPSESVALSEVSLQTAVEKKSFVEESHEDATASAWSSRTGACKLAAFYPGSPADLDGNIRVLDRVLQINGVELAGKTLPEAIGLIAGGPLECRLRVARLVEKKPDFRQLLLERLDAMPPADVQLACRRFLSDLDEQKTAEGKVVTN
ncbi:hypothetical protein M3Y99_01291300 [Aphelenchoides fujianensis]|nr:hypothetical protein M3Y99_01291300 [Aphelenchoides fujianensis]